MLWRTSIWPKQLQILLFASTKEDLWQKKSDLTTKVLWVHHASALLSLFEVTINWIESSPKIVILTSVILRVQLVERRPSAKSAARNVLSVCQRRRQGKLPFLRKRLLSEDACVGWSCLLQLCRRAGSLLDCAHWERGQTARACLQAESNSRDTRVSQLAIFFSYLNSPPIQLGNRKD